MNPDCKKGQKLLYSPSGEKPQIVECASSTTKLELLWVIKTGSTQPKLAKLAHLRPLTKEEELFLLIGGSLE